MPNRENITDTSTTSATAGILIRSDGAPGNADRNHYYLGIYPGQDLWKLFRKTATDGWQLIDSDDMTIDMNSYYTLSATADGDTITLYLDGKQLGDPVTDSTHTSGHVGLRVRNATARFDDVRAEGLAYGSPASYLYNEATGALMHELDASLFFRLLSRRYEKASIIITSNKSFTDWGEIFGDQVMATAILDRLLHHSTVISIKGDSYRLREKKKAGMLEKQRTRKEKTDKEEATEKESAKT